MQNLLMQSTGRGSFVVVMDPLKYNDIDIKFKI